jgi:hypothetical protein
LYWNDSVSEYSLTTTDRVSLYYLKNWYRKIIYKKNK